METKVLNIKISVSGRTIVLAEKILDGETIIFTTFLDNVFSDVEC